MFLFSWLSWDRCDFCGKKKETLEKVWGDQVTHQQYACEECIEETKKIY